MNEAVETQDAGSIRWISLNRPRAANAIDTALADGLAAALSAAESDTSVTAVVLTGAGTRVFCAGIDIRNGESAEARRRNLRTCLWSILDFPKPLVAAVNGIASGGGCMMALLADRRVMANETAMVLPEIDIGIPAFPALGILSRLMGDALAGDLVLSARRFSAAEAGRWGLATAVSADALVATADEQAAQLGAKPADTYRLSKAWLNSRMRAAINDAMVEGEKLRGG